MYMVDHDLSYLPQTSNLKPFVVSFESVVFTSNDDVFMSSSVWKLTAIYKIY